MLAWYIDTFMGYSGGMRETKFKQFARWVPAGLLLVVAVAMFFTDAVGQSAAYHGFADTRRRLGIPNAGDVVSNVGFAIVGIWGLSSVRDKRYRFFLWALLLTAFGSGYYHLAPDNERLVWDRLPIALACAGLLAAVHAETHPPPPSRFLLPALAAAAIAGVLWWAATERVGSGDLRPYIVMQAAPLVFIPLWQWIHRSPRADRVAFGVAIALYVAAKVAGHYDRAIFESLGFMSGHSLKHLLAAAAGAVIVANLARREGVPIPLRDT
jgi:hypothetical protein